MSETERIAELWESELRAWLPAEYRLVSHPERGVIQRVPHKDQYEIVAYLYSYSRSFMTGEALERGVTRAELRSEISAMLFEAAAHHRRLAEELQQNAVAARHAAGISHE